MKKIYGIVWYMLLLVSMTGCVANASTVPHMTYDGESSRWDSSLRVEPNSEEKATYILTLDYKGDRGRFTEGTYLYCSFEVNGEKFSKNINIPSNFSQTGRIEERFTETSIEDMEKVTVSVFVSDIKESIATHILSNLLNSDTINYKKTS